MAEGTLHDGDLYDADIVAWAEQQATALRAVEAGGPGRTNAVDWTHVIEEIEAVGRSQVNGVERRLTLVLVHLIKKLSSPDAPPAHLWRAEIVAFQTAARRSYTASMRQRIDWDDLWTSAVREAEASLVPYGDALPRGLPAALPFTPEELLDRSFDVDAALLRLAQRLAAGADKA